MKSRRTTDSFVVNKPSVSPETEEPIGQFYSCWQIIDWSVVEMDGSDKTWEETPTKIKTLSYLKFKKEYKQILVNSQR